MCRRYLTSYVLLLSAGAWSDDGKLADPTRPEGLPQRAAVASGGKAVLPKLSSVLIGDHRRLAVIDGRLMAEGDSEGGVRVRRISNDRVVVDLGDDAHVTLLLDRAGIHKEVR